ncbi:hypothetical protein C0580_03665 [Candidatus Parcubacteria bacterium]|nr:MAG: hypothetical protein C0580_03665 [Candidatus Parcubacteria bacterium]
MVKVTDATGMSSEIGLSIFGVEPDIYIPPLTVDVTASPHQAQQGEDISFHADVRGGDYDLVEWYVVGNDVEIGRGDDITHNFQRLGFEYVEARVYNWGNFLAADTVRVTITPMDAPDSLSVDVTGGPQGLVEPVTATLEAHPSGGDGNYQYIWYWPTADHVFSTERFPIIGDLMAGSHTFICEVTDGIGNTADDEIVITVLEQPDDNTLIWSVCPNLQVGPSDDFASTTATVEVSGEYRNGYLQIEWDAVPSGTSSEVLVEVLRSDEHRYTWHLIKPSSWGRKTVYYEVGSLNLQEGEVSLNMYWLGDDKSSKSAARCDGWDKWQLIWANTTMPADKAGDAMVIDLDHPDRSHYIQRQ